MATISTTTRIADGYEAEAGDDDSEVDDHMDV